MSVSKTLFLPFDQEAIPAPDDKQRILFINGQPSAALNMHLSCADLTIQQYFKPYAEMLEKAAYKVSTDIPTDKQYDIILVLGGKQQKETRYFIACALEALKSGGLLVCAAANDSGGKRLAKDFKALSLPYNEESKYHARVVWATKPATYNDEKAALWLTEGKPQPVDMGEHSFLSQPGIFGWNKIDKGSALLAQHLPTDLKGKGADFGCGYGFLSTHVLRTNPKIKALYALDADERAAQACLQNMAAIKHEAPTECLWQDLTKPLERRLLPPLDWIIMNPPFHEGKATKNSAAQAFIITAAQALRPRGRLYIVANAHLPYESLLTENFKYLDKVFEGQGFKIFETVR